MQSDLKNAGKRFGEYVSNLSIIEPKSTHLHALARDIFSDNQEILEPILSIVSRPDFRYILKLAGTGTGHIQKSAFIAELRKIYTSQIVTQLSLIIDGILAIDSNNELDLYDDNLEAISYDELESCAMAVEDFVFAYEENLEDQDHYAYQSHGYDSDLSSNLHNTSVRKTQLSSSVDKPFLLIEGITLLLALTPFVAGFATTVTIKFLPQINTGYLIIIYAAVVYWCFSAIGVISSERRIIVKKWLSLSSPPAILRDIAITYENGLNFFQFLALLITLCWLLVAPLFTFSIKII